MANVPSQEVTAVLTSVAMTAVNDAYMRASDAFTWYMERDPALRSTVVVVDWLDRAPTGTCSVGRVDRLSRLMPSLRQHVVESPFGLTVPRSAYDRIPTWTGT